MRDQHLTARELVAEGWGNDAPDWIIALAEARDTSSAANLAKLVGFSFAAIQGALKNTYPSSLDNLERAVRGTVMNAPVDCPELGPIKRDRCLRSYEQSLRGGHASKFSRIMRDACASCLLKPKKGSEK